MSKFLYPYKVGSASVSALRDTGVVKVIKRENSRFSPALNKLVINWGCSEIPSHITAGCSILNHPETVQEAVNKRSFFQKIAEYNLHSPQRKVNIPDFTTEREEAVQWVRSGVAVCVRERLTGNSGAGLSIADSPEQIVSAPLYTKYVKKRDEYRVHVFGGEVLKIQRKARSSTAESHNPRIRNHENGYIFQQNGFECPPCVPEQALRAVAAMGLDFGGVDVIYNQHQDKAYVLEINTAPGIEGDTVARYAEAIRNISMAS